MNDAIIVAFLAQTIPAVVAAIAAIKAAKVEDLSGKQGTLL